MKSKQYKWINKFIENNFPIIMVFIIWLWISIWVAISIPYAKEENKQCTPSQETQQQIIERLESIENKIK